MNQVDNISFRNYLRIWIYNEPGREKIPFIPQIDCVLLGAEGVCESGGIVNQLGSLPVALVANKVKGGRGDSGCFLRIVSF